RSRPPISKVAGRARRGRASENCLARRGRTLDLSRAHRHLGRWRGLSGRTRARAVMEAFAANFLLYGSARGRRAVFSLRSRRRESPVALLLSRHLRAARWSGLAWVPHDAHDANGHSISLAI